MVDLSTSYLGLTLKHPIVASASPLGRDVVGVQRLVEAGAAAVVLPSLFEEQINAESYQLDHYLSYGVDSFPEALSYFPALSAYQTGPDAYLRLVEESRAAVDVPVIASLNGVSTGGWIEYAVALEEAGASALELNIYYLPTNPRLSGAEVEQMYLDVVADVRASIKLPIALKFSPFFSALANMAVRLAEAGAHGLVLFNRFYQPDFDLDALAVVPHLVLSDSDELRLPLRWAAILYDHVDADLAVSSGVHTYEDALKCLLAGAKVTMMASELLHHGLGRIGEIVVELEHWLEKHEYASVRQLIGSMSQQNCAEPAAFERANYMRVLQSWRPDPTGLATH